MSLLGITKLFLVPNMSLYIKGHNLHRAAKSSLVGQAYMFYIFF
jgi:hypothetical protein